MNTCSARVLRMETDRVCVRKKIRSCWRILRQSASAGFIKRPQQTVRGASSRVPCVVQSFLLEHVSGNGKTLLNGMQICSSTRLENVGRDSRDTLSISSPMNANSRGRFVVLGFDDSRDRYCLHRAITGERRWISIDSSVGWAVEHTANGTSFLLNGDDVVPTNKLLRKRLVHEGVSYVVRDNVGESERP